MEGEITLHSSYVKLINSGETVTDHQKRLTVFQGLSCMFSLITIKENTKKCYEDEWQRWCLEKKPFKDEDFIYKNAGIACGPASGVIVIDVDDPEGTNRWLKKRGLFLPEETFTIKTNRGYHLYLMYPENNIKYKSRKISENEKTLFEIKSIGAYVVAPGSVHPDTGKAYTIEKNIEIIPAQGWILDLSLNPNKYKSNECEIVNAHEDESDNIFDETLPGKPYKIDINSLPISSAAKSKILEHHPKGSRSEAEMSVIESLLRANVEEEIIIKVFEEYPIGEKHREHGDGRFKRMSMQIEKAKEYLGPNITTQADVFSLKTADQIRKSKKKIDFIIEPILAKRDSLLILGKGGVGKSLFLLDMIITLAMTFDRKFIGLNIIEKQLRTLIFQSENSESCVNERFENMFGEDEIPQSVLENIIFISENDDILVTGDLNEGKFYEKVTKTIELCKPDIIVFDPLISFYVGDENHNNGMRKVLDIVSRIIREQNVAAIIIHHDGKASTSSGSGGRGASAIGDWTANSLKLIETKDQDFVILEHVKCRYRKPLEQLTLMRNDQLRFELVESGQDSSTNSNYDIIIEAFGNLGKTITVKSKLVTEVNRLLKEKGQDGKAHNTILKMLDATVEKGLITLDNKTYSLK